MQKRILPALFAAAVTVVIVISACTKIDTTTIGSDALTVDNINTFADTLKPDIIATEFSLPDSTILSKEDNYIIGNIQGTVADPLFGKTSTAIFAEFKPPVYPYYFGNAGDTVRNDAANFAGLDSVVVTLSYKSAWGDTSASGSAPQFFDVFEIDDQPFHDKTDTVRPVSYQPTYNNTLLGTAIVTPQIAAKKVVFNQNTDSVDNQIRIKIGQSDPGFARFSTLYYSQDSSATGANNAFFSDTKFRQYAFTNKLGIAIVPRTTGNANTLFTVNMAETKTRLEFHYRKTKGGVHSYGVSYFRMYSTAIGNDIAASPCTNYIKRDYSGSQVATPGTDHVYLQSSPSPGCFVNIKIPGLTNYANRIVHRAFLIVEQTPDNPVTDKNYTAPPYLYLDLRNNTGTNVFKPVYFDLNGTYPYNPDVTFANGLYHPYPAANVSVSNFGGIALQRYEAGTGTPFTRYEINLTRYVQHIVSNGYNNYEMRLFAPYSYYYPQYAGAQYIIPYFNPLATGRVRVGSGTNTGPHKMKMVVIYSKI